MKAEKLSPVEATLSTKKARRGEIWYHEALHFILTVYAGTDRRMSLTSNLKSEIVALPTFYTF